MFAALGTVQYITVEVLAAFGIRIRGGQRNDDAARGGPGVDGEVEKDKTDKNMRATRRALADTIDYINSVADEFKLQGRIALLSHEGYNPDLEELNQWDKAQAQRR